MSYPNDRIVVDWTRNSLHPRLKSLGVSVKVSSRLLPASAMAKAKELAE
jgi:hypothetical protein